MEITIAAIRKKLADVKKAKWSDTILINSKNFLELVIESMCT